MNKEENKLDVVGFVGWGPIETLSNGYFMRVYSLTELITQRLEKTFVIIEYTEDSSSELYEITKIDKIRALKIEVPGNEKRFSNTFFRYIRFVLYQLVNTFKLRKIIRKFHMIIVAGELFAPTILIVRLVKKNAVVVADPQMLLSEREERAGRKFSVYLLKILETLYFKNSDLIIAISKNMRSIIIHRFGIPKEKILIIPHSLPKKLLRTKPCKNGKNNRITAKLLFVGSLEARQNLEAAAFLIRVLPVVLLHSGKKIELIFAGHTNEEILSYLINLSEKYNVSKHVKILGYVENLDEVACESHVFLAPMFTMSGVSTKMLYYLRFSDKVIMASREAIEGIEELAKKHGKVVVGDNPREFVLKLIKVIKEL